MERHLSLNDYYSEGETIEGRWHGEAASILGIEGQLVTSETFEALRSNRHPSTGEKLRPRRAKVAYHDFVLSAPKTVSIAAMTGEDTRLLEAYDRCAMRVFKRLESFAAVRVRTGSSYNTEELTITGNGVAAVFRHDTSRMLDPQLHTHMVFANLSWDESGQRWLALQPRVMGEQGAEWIRGKFYRELAVECRKLGYQTEQAGESFRLSGISQSTEQALSQRSVQREAFKKRYVEMFGHQPDKKRVEWFIKDGKTAAIRRFKDEYRAKLGKAPDEGIVANFVQDWRSAKMATTTREEVHALQLSRISREQREEITSVVSKAYKVSEGVVHKPRSVADGSKRWKINKNKSVVRHKKRKIRGGLGRARVIDAVLHGHPTAMMARNLLKLARRTHGTQRRIR